MSKAELIIRCQSIAAFLKMREEKKTHTQYRAVRNREMTAFRDEEIRTMTRYVFRFCNVLYTVSIYFPVPTIKGGNVILFFKKKKKFHLFIHLAAPRLSCDMQDIWLWHVGSSSLRGIEICVPCIGIVESKPLDRQGSLLIFYLITTKSFKGKSLT